MEKSQDTWKEDLVYSEDSFMLLQNILMEAGELENYVPFEALVMTGAYDLNSVGKYIAHVYGIDTHGVRVEQDIGLCSEPLCR